MKSLKDNLSFKAEMVYSLQGAKSIENNRAFYSYINLPLLLSFDVGNHLYFDVGPQCGLMFNGTIKTGTSKSFVTPDLTTLDLALCIGLGVKLDKFLIWETRCNYGVTNISRYSQSPDVLRNVVIQTGLLLKLEKHDNENN